MPHNTSSVFSISHCGLHRGLSKSFAPFEVGRFRSKVRLASCCAFWTQLLKLAKIYEKCEDVGKEMVDVDQDVEEKSYITDEAAEMVMEGKDGY